jgi:hypothetical protein
MTTKFHTILTDQKFYFESREIDLDVKATKLKNHRKLQPKIPVVFLIDTIGRLYPMEDCLAVAEHMAQNRVKAMIAEPAPKRTTITIHPLRADQGNPTSRVKSIKGKVVTLEPITKVKATLDKPVVKAKKK